DVDHLGKLGGLRWVSSPAATAATMLAVAATQSAGFSIGGNSKATGSSLRAGASRSMPRRMALRSPALAISIALSPIAAASSANWLETPLFIRELTKSIRLSPQIDLQTCSCCGASSPDFVEPVPAEPRGAATCQCRPAQRL